MTIEALSKLNDVISHPSTLFPNYGMEIDNVIFALGNICEHQTDCINASQVFIIFLLNFSLLRNWFHINMTTMCGEWNSLIWYLL